MAENCCFENEFEEEVSMCDVVIPNITTHEYLFESSSQPFEEEQTQEDLQKKYFMNESKLTTIQKSIQAMNKHHQIEVGKILYSYKNITLNENRYGIFVNLTELDQSVIQKLYGYIFYTNEQENSLLKNENEKAEFKTKYFSDTCVV
jgi:uncharacterized protein (DUF342 family)